MSISRWRTASGAIVMLCLGLSALPGPATALQQPGTQAAAPAVRKPFTIPQLGPDGRAQEPFDVATTALGGGEMMRKWHEVQAGLTQEYQTLHRCRQDPAGCAAAPAQFLALINDTSRFAGLSRIAAVNHAVNAAIRPLTDMHQYGKAELWATPLMTFTSGAGDCEDYAIAKYAALIELGVAPDDLRLLAVYDHRARENHAVAAVRFEGRWLILDNLAAELEDAARSTRLKPLFVLADRSVRRVDADQPPPSRDRDRQGGFAMSDLPEAWSISFGLIAPVL